MIRTDFIYQLRYCFEVFTTNYNDLDFHFASVIKIECWV